MKVLGMGLVEDLFVCQTYLNVRSYCAAFKTLVLSTRIFKKLLCVSLTVPEARHICLAYDG